MSMIISIAHHSRPCCYITLHYIILHYITSHYMSLHHRCALPLYLIFAHYPALTLHCKIISLPFHCHTIPNHMIPMNERTKHWISIGIVNIQQMLSKPNSQAKHLTCKGTGLVAITSFPSPWAFWHLATKE